MLKVIDLGKPCHLGEGNGGQKAENQLGTRLQARTLDSLASSCLHRYDDKEIYYPRLLMRTFSLVGMIC